MSTTASTLSTVRALFAKEFRELVATRSFWVMLLVICPLIGFSFIEAVFLYGQAGEGTLGDTILMSRMSPLDGIFVPTFSGLYLSEVFLFPFVAIRMLGVEKQFGSIKFLLQVCPSVMQPLLVKTVVIMFAFFVSLIPAISALAIWHQLGGSIYLPEILVLFLGHVLFALLIVSIAFFAVAITDSPQTAAIVTLAFTISSWVLEFAGQNQSTLNSFAWLSMTAHLRLFESALFSLKTVLGFLLASAGFLCVAAIWLKSSDDTAGKFRKTAVLALLIGVLGLGVNETFYYRDYSEKRINSFSPRNEASLKRLTLPLKITIHLSPDDSLSVDFEREFLSKLRRVLKNLTVVYIPPLERTSNGAGDPNFGLVSYDYGGGRMESHEVGARGALRMLHVMTGTYLEGEPESPFQGRLIKADASQYRILFYLLMPLSIVLVWVGSLKWLRKCR